MGIFQGKEWVGYKAEQDRDDHGRFSGPGGSEKTGMELVKSTHKDAEVQIDKLDVFSHAFDKNTAKDVKEHIARLPTADTYLTSVAIKDLHPTQPSVSAGSLLGIIKSKAYQSGEGDEPVVMKHNGKLYIVDGHHRIAAAGLKGRTTINVMIKAPK